MEEEGSFIQSYPWSKWNIFCRLSQTKDHKDILDNLKGKEIRAYCEGWLVVENMKVHAGKRHEDIKMHHLDLISLNSSKKIRLPSLKSCYDICILTRSPTHLDSRVLFATRDTIRYCRPGDKKYETRKLEESMRIKDDMVAVVEGKVYYAMVSGSIKPVNLVMIDCSGSNLQLTKLEIKSFVINEVVSRYCTCYLVGSGGELLLVLKSYSPVCSNCGPKEIDFFLVFQFDSVNMSWKQVDNIGNSTIFLPITNFANGFGGISFCATEPLIRRNSIYFLKPQDEYVHVYDMNNRSFSLFPKGLKMNTLHVQEESDDPLHYEKQNMEFLPELHSDVSNLVLGRIFTIDPGAIGVIRSTCKDWSRIVRPPASQIDLRYYKYPYLVTLVNGTCHFFHPTYSHTFYLDMPELLGSHLRCSKFGWLLLSRTIKPTEKAEYFFFNLFTRQKMSLPNPDPQITFQTMAFSSPPTSSNCFAVAADIIGISVSILKCGEDRWKFVELGILGPLVNNHPVFQKQKCYFFGLRSDLVVVDLTTRNIYFVGKTFLGKFPKLCDCFLFEDDKGLLAVFLTAEKKAPFVMRMDFSQPKMVWQPVPNLNGKMVYVSRAACRSVSAPTRSTGNKIYFPLFRGSSHIFYSLSTGKYHSFSGNYSSETPFEVQRMTNCAWIDIV